MAMHWAVRVEALLQALVEVERAGLAAIHGREHLDVGAPVPPPITGQPRGAQLLHPLDHPLWVAFLDKVEIRARMVIDDGHFAAVDAVRVADDVAFLGLAKNLRQAHHRYFGGVDNVAEHVARPHRGQLVDVADEHHPSVVGQGAQERVHQHHVDHGSLIDDQGVELEAVVVAPFELPLARLKFQQPMNGLGRSPARFAQPLGRAARGRAQRNRETPFLQKAQDAPRDRGLARARPAGQHQHFARGNPGHSLFLRRGQC